MQSASSNLWSLDWDLVGEWDSSLTLGTMPKRIVPNAMSKRCEIV
jgi:hypothetical protein